MSIPPVLITTLLNHNNDGGEPKPTRWWEYVLIAIATAIIFAIICFGIVSY